ncbi:MAG: DUF2786 domain-containing protein [Planctomycetota bacterium]
MTRLRWHFDLYNDQYLASKLRPPLFRIGGSQRRLGQWNPASRTIDISEHHILSHSWETVLDTLRHEMAHQYVDEVLRLSHAPPHGEPFQRACQLLRCEHAATASSGKLESLKDSNDERDKNLKRIKEILALAGSPNEHEAASAMRMAHKYLLKYNLDIAQVERESMGYKTRYLGRSSARVQEYQYTLSSILQDHFFVLPIWTYSYDAQRNLAGRILQISGTEENLEMAEYVHNYVIHHIDSLWEAKRRAPQKPTRKKKGTKLQYFAGLLRGFQEKLLDEERHLREEHGLVWMGDPELKNYFRNLHPRTRSVYTSGVARNASFHDGVREGRKIVIRRGLPGDSKSRGRLLGGGENN